MCTFLSCLYRSNNIWGNDYVLLKISLWFFIVFKVKPHFSMFYAVIFDSFYIKFLALHLVFQRHGWKFNSSDRHTTIVFSYFFYSLNWPFLLYIYWKVPNIFIFIIIYTNIIFFYKIYWFPENSYLVCIIFSYLVLLCYN